MTKRVTAPAQRKTKNARVNKLRQAAKPRAKAAAVAPGLATDPDVDQDAQRDAAAAELIASRQAAAGLISAETREEKRELYQDIAQAESVEVFIRAGNRVWKIDDCPPNPHVLRICDFDYQRTRN